MESSIKNKIIRLRKKGKTYSEINAILNKSIPKSTLSYWCNDIVLKSAHKRRIERIVKNNLKRGRKKALLRNKEKQEKILRDIETDNNFLRRKKLDKDMLKIVLSVLYLGEGAKWRSHRGLMLGSTDSNIILLYMKLLQACYGIKKDKLKCRISYRADQDIKILEKYWSKITGIPLSSFYKTKPDPRTIGKKTKRKNYKGVCVVSCAGTRIQLELEMIPKLILEGPIV